MHYYGKIVKQVTALVLTSCCFYYFRYLIAQHYLNNVAFMSRLQVCYMSSYVPFFYCLVCFKLQYDSKTPSTSPSSGAMHPNKEEVRQKHQEACMDEQGAPGQAQTQTGSLQRVEARTGSLGGIERNCLSSQGSG